MFEIDRTLFKAWTEGIIMSRNCEGECLVVDGLEKKFEKVKEAMDKGHTIYLTDRGKIVTKMFLGESGYEEERVTIPSTCA